MPLKQSYKNVGTSYLILIDAIIYFLYLFPHILLLNPESTTPFLSCNDLQTVYFCERKNFLLVDTFIPISHGLIIGAH